MRMTVTPSGRMTLVTGFHSDWTYTKALAAEVRATAARSQVTGVDIAKALNLSQMAVSRRLRGETPFDVEELAAVCQLLSISVESVLPKMHQVMDPVAQVQARREAEKQKPRNVRTPEGFEPPTF